MLIPPHRHEFLFQNHRATLFLPQNPPAKKIPWVLYAPAQGFSACNLWILQKLLDQNIALATIDVGESAGSPDSRQTFFAFHQHLTQHHNFAPKAVLWPQSRGGLMLYNFAADHPELIQAVAGIYTVCDLADWPHSLLPNIQKYYAQALEAYHFTHEQFLAQLPQNNPIDRLAPLAALRIPIFHIHGDADRIVPLEPHALELTTRYRALGGPATLVVIPNKGHEEAPEFFHSQPFADFLITQAQVATKADPPHEQRTPLSPSCS